MNFRDESPHDQKEIFHSVSSAFDRNDEAQLIEQLREAGDVVLSLVAVEDSQVVGHVLLSKMKAPFPSLALAPVSVSPTRQKCGIGSALIERAVRRAQDEGWAAIFVLGDPGFYERFGFSHDATTGFSSPYSGSHFMMLKLWHSLPTTAGELLHAPAFGVLG